MENALIPFSVLPPRHQLRKADFCVEGQPGAGYVLGEDGGKGSTSDAPAEDHDEHKVQHNIHYGRDSQKKEGSPGVSHRAKQAGKIIVEKCAYNSGKYNEQIVLHQSCDGTWNPKEPDDPVNADKDSCIQHHGHCSDKDERLEDA